MATSPAPARSRRTVGEGGERLYCMCFQVRKADSHAVPANVLVESVAGRQRALHLLAKFTRNDL